MKKYNVNGKLITANDQIEAVKKYKLTKDSDQTDIINEIKSKYPGVKIEALKYKEMKDNVQHFRFIIKGNLPEGLSRFDHTKKQPMEKFITYVMKKHGYDDATVDFSELSNGIIVDGYKWSGTKDSIKDVNPIKGESKEEFLARFMNETSKEYPDEKQRYAVANSYWEKAKDSIHDYSAGENLMYAVNMIEIMKKKGYTSSKIRGILKDAGVSDELIKEAFRQAGIKDSVKDADSNDILEKLISEEERAINDYKRAIIESDDLSKIDLYTHILREEIEHLEELRGKSTHDVDVEEENDTVQDSINDGDFLEKIRREDEARVAKWPKKDADLWRKLMATNGFKNGSYLDKTDSFTKDVKVIPTGEILRNVRFVKEIHQNAIFEPRYIPEEQYGKYHNYAWVYDGNSKNGCIVIDRADTWEHNEMLSR